MRLLCGFGLHRLLWLPVLVPNVDSTGPSDARWLQVRRCVNCGRVVGRQHRG